MVNNNPQQELFCLSDDEIADLITVVGATFLHGIAYSSLIKDGLVFQQVPGSQMTAMNSVANVNINVAVDQAAVQASVSIIGQYLASARNHAMKNKKPTDSGYGSE